MWYNVSRFLWGGVRGMKKIKNKNDLLRETERVTNSIERYIQSIEYKKACNLVYWFDTWIDNYLPSEKTFEYEKLLHYERGMVVKADLGFKVGSEEGGLHYAVVVENDNSKDNKTVMVIPLSSLELSEDISIIDKKHEVFLGYGIFKNEISKTESLLKNTITQLQLQGKSSEQIDNETFKIKTKLSNYQKGSIALVNQMCALSKIRIHSPTNINDELADFRLDTHKLNEIDKRIKTLYTKKNPIKVKLEEFVGIFKK